MAIAPIGGFILLVVVVFVLRERKHRAFQDNWIDDSPGSPNM
jgi:hypothetical protein